MNLKYLNFRYKCLGGIIIEIKKITSEELIDLVESKKYDYLVLQGCGDDLNEWIDEITELLKEKEIIDEEFMFNEVFTFKNKGVTNLALALNDKRINLAKLAIFRLKIKHLGAMWLSDYVDNYIDNHIDNDISI